MARGLADDFLSTFALAVRCPILLAPAMNTRMWENAAVRDNVAILAARGVHFIGPAEGALAEEEWGVGRLADPDAIVEKATALLGWKRSLAGRTVLVTAGPTWEHLDAVRILSNPSSGKMGYAVAEAAVRRGARVILVSGPSALPDPEGAEVVRVTSASEMHEAVMRRAGEAGIVVKAAAVADFTPAEPSERKFKKTGEPVRVDLVPTRDILKDLSALGGKRILVGFAAETDDLLANARAKLLSKRLDLIVANDVGRGAVFGKDESDCVILDREGREIRLERLTKTALAERLLDLVEERLAA
jgi:phosphopantothenoylcysteine decarboxylase/phosphopantothenate--cysteine ligase